MKTAQRIFLALSLLSSVTLAAPKSSPAASTPMGQLKFYNDQLDKLIKKKATGAEGALSKEDTATLKTLLAELLDYTELSRRSLGAQWDKLTKAQRDDFIKTFNELIEKNYVKQLRTNVDYAVTYKNEAITDGEATVATVVKVHTKGKSTDAAIDYKMHKADGRWLVYDVVTDEVSMLRNYRSQFSKIIANESFDALLQKMRKRISDSETKDEKSPKEAKAATTELK